MDLISVESCSSSRSSPSPAAPNASEERTEQIDVLDTSNSSDTSVSPASFSLNSSNCQHDQNDNGRNEAYWEKRKRNNDAAKKSREKRRISDMMMEKKLFELVKENCLLKSRLSNFGTHDSTTFLQQPSRLPNESVIVTRPKLEIISPQKPLTTLTDLKTTIQNSSKFLPAISNHFLNSDFTTTNHIASTQQLFHLRHLTSNLIQQSTSGLSTIFSGRGAFQPFHSSKDATVISNSNQRNSPDSSTNDPFLHSINKNMVNGDSVSDLQTSKISQLKCIRPMTVIYESKGCDQENKPQSLLGSLLATRRTSPLVQQSCTDIQSGLNNTSIQDNDLKNCLKSLVVNLGAVKSDTESVESPKSNKSTSDSLQSQCSPPTNSAIVEALNSRSTNKQKYMDRRKRNNEAAKRCRANRRAQFEYRSRRAQQLEIENDELRKEMNRLKHELEQLKAMQAAQNALQS